MTDKTYNGWTNYETWRVNLEIFDGMQLQDLWGFEDAAPEEINEHDLSMVLKDYVEELIYQSGGRNGNLAVDYALAFLSEVDWYSIAKHMIDAAIDEQKYQMVSDASRSYGPQANERV
jgi:hypothetical protein